MAVFPDIGSVPYTNPLEETVQYKTLVTRLNDLGEEQRRAKWLYPRRAFSLKYQAISVSQARTLWDFYMQRRGRYEAFNFFYPMTGTYTGEYVGTGDGSTTNFNAPCKSATGVTIYVDGVAQPESGSIALTNPGFETGDGTGWSWFDEEESATVSYVTEKSHGGNYSCKIVQSGTPSGSCLYRDISITGRATYTMSVWFWAEAGNYARICLRDQTHSQSDYAHMEGNGEWQFLFVSYSFPSDASQGRVILYATYNQENNTVYYDDVQVEKSLYTVNGGEDGADLISFATAPDDGARITMDFTGYLKVRCRFAEDMLDFQTFYARLVSAGIKLQGLLNS